MSLILDGSNGLSDVDGTAATPAIRGTDTNTGIFFPAADTIAFAEGGAEVARFDSAGNLGIGTASPTVRLAVSNSAGGNVANFTNTSSADLNINLTAGVTLLTPSTGTLALGTSNTERMRITSDGSLIVGTTAEPTGTTGGSAFMASSVGRRTLVIATTTTGTANLAEFVNPNGRVGSISTNASATTYSTSSDYRLKENVAPMTGALARVSALKPVTYQWKVDGSAGEGFIAHELQAIVPDCVTGEKDAVDAKGNPVYQGIDTSFLVATLTAAIQELKAELDSVKAELATLKA